MLGNVVKTTSYKFIASYVLYLKTNETGGMCSRVFPVYICKIEKEKTI